jgi:Spy/CpxP family protein refolding chaperone
MKRFAGRLTVVAATLLLPVLLLVLSPKTVVAQEEGAQEASGQTNQGGDMIRQLNLTPEQVQKIREIRESNKEERRAITQRLRLAQIALDRAIYYDNADEAVVEERVRELTAAQNAAVRMRALTELNIRRVLTPDQLATLRTLRQQARMAERNRRMQDVQNQQQNGVNRSLMRDRFGRGQNPPAQPRDGNSVRPIRQRRGDALRGRQP